jgi:hypothetical protein
MQVLAHGTLVGYEHEVDISVLLVIPVVSRESAEKCIESILSDNNACGVNKKDILIIDNTKEGLGEDYHGLRVYRDLKNHNIGVARAWNIGAREVVEKNIDYLIVMSSSMLFGVMKETTLLRQIATYKGFEIIEAEGHSWHLIAFKRDLFLEIGYFDENFYPAYFEDIDFAFRLRLLNQKRRWATFWVNAISQSTAKHSHLCSAEPLLKYYKAKWGGDKGAETYNLPFNNKPIEYFKQNNIELLASRYELTEWW